MMIYVEELTVLRIVWAQSDLSVGQQGTTEDDAESDNTWIYIHEISILFLQYPTLMAVLTYNNHDD